MCRTLPYDEVLLGAYLRADLQAKQAAHLEASHRDS
jgi:hypothetical protein